jgi:YggT family protein
MFVISNLFSALATVVDAVLTFVYWLIIVRALISWVNPDPYNPIVQFLYKSTEPILYPIRKILPSSFRFGLDLSPLIAILLIIFFQRFLVSTLREASYRLG